MPDPLGPMSQRRFVRLSGYQVFNSHHLDSEMQGQRILNAANVTQTSYTRLRYAMS